MKQERYYQTEAKIAVKENLEKGVNKQLIVMATGTGKTWTAVSLINELKEEKQFKRVIWGTHLEELVEQSAIALLAEMDLMPYDSLLSIINNAGGLLELIRSNKNDMFLDDNTKAIISNIGIVKADLFDVDKPIVVASMQTLHRRLDRIPNNWFDIMVCDEAHLFGSNTFVKSVNYFDVKLRLGLTATPHRTDGMMMGDIFDKIVYEYGIDKGIEDGFLCELDAKRIASNVNIDKVRTTAGEFNQKDLEVLVNTRERNNLIVNKYNEYAAGRQFIAYCVDVQHARDLNDAFLEKGFKTNFIVGDENLTPNRRGLIAQLKNKEIDGLTNCMVLCLDESTEILTTKGWTKIDEMTYQHEVANFDETNGKIFFDYPKFIVKRQRELGEKMVSLKSPFKDIRVTSNHQMLFKNRTQNKWRKTDAKNLVNRKEIEIPVCGIAEPRKVSLPIPYLYSKQEYNRAISANSFNLRRNNKLSIEQSKIVAKQRLDEKLKMKHSNPDELSFDECRFIGFWLGDGSKWLEENHLRYNLSQSVVYPNIIQWIDDLLFKIGLHSIKRKKKAEKSKPNSSDSFTWELSRGTGCGEQKRNGVFHLEPYLDKNGNLLEYFNEQQFSAFIEGFWFADGNHLKRKTMPKTRCMIYNSNLELFNKIQAIGVTRGYRMTIQKMSLPKKEHHKQLYTLSFNKQNVFSIGTKYFQIEDKFIEERVWCVTSTTGNIVTRRNNHVTIMGNTTGFDYPDLGCIINAAPTKSLTKFIQCVGRGARLKSSEYVDVYQQNCIILDVVDSTTKHRLVNTWTLDKAKPFEEKTFMTKEQKLMFIAKREAKYTVTDPKQKKDVKVNLFALPKVKYSDSIRMQEPATEKQLEWVKSLGYDIEATHYTKMMCTEIISMQMATDKQIGFLRWKGYDVSNGVTLGEAKLAFEQIKEREEVATKKARAKELAQKTDLPFEDVF